jgi:tetratricopeptide (TPR) repeat protein
MDAGSGSGDNLTPMLSRRRLTWIASLFFLPGALGATPPVKRANEVRRDPHGVKGISPFQEALKEGDNALIARDFDGAIAAYRQAITREPENAIGHYRVAEAQVMKGDLHEADEAIAAGLRFVAADAALKAKLEFALADLRERQRSYDEATEKWSDYQTLTTEQKDAHGFPESARERKRALEAWKKLSAESAEVKARIEKRLRQVDESVPKGSK